MCEHCQHKETIDTSIDRMWLRPVGVVVSEIKQPTWGAGSGDMDPATRDERHKANIEKYKRERNLISELVIDSELVDGGILDGIEGFSHLLVLYWPHLTEPDRTRMQGHPLGREDFPLVGIFARSGSATCCESPVWTPSTAAL